MAGISVEITAILNDYNKELNDAVKNAAKEAADYTAKTLVSTSPADKGKYRKGWKVKRVESGLLTGYVVHNTTAPGLTHLLEYGHISMNQYGTWGRVAARPHIAPAESEGIRKFEESVRNRMR